MPKEIIGDSHYGSTDLRVDLAEHGVDVIAKLPGASFRNGDRFTKADFDIDLEAEAVTCPAGTPRTSITEGAMPRAGTYGASASRPRPAMPVP